MKDYLTELIDINDFTTKYHHSLSAKPGAEILEDVALRPIVTRTIKLIQSA